ncbi:hypothetical protein BU16DRAFT_35619 [Lophium mytilinum]|uniref:Uncharacterized protein n=1 Tax=Lophium mytilinum TaxID=390894 RepID=A0A6A6REY5_9PEZI|nr:hypothetical protein BU16DRAFT_35619 [Lophium mytilinum]
MRAAEPCPRRPRLAHGVVDGQNGAFAELETVLLLRIYLTVPPASPVPPELPRRPLRSAVLHHLLPESPPSHLLLPASAAKCCQCCKRTSLPPAGPEPRFVSPCVAHPSACPPSAWYSAFRFVRNSTFSCMHARCRQRAPSSPGTRPLGANARLATPIARHLNTDSQIARSTARNLALSLLPT